MISVIEFISKTVTYYPSQKAFAKVSAVNINKIIVFSTKKKKKKKKKLATDALKNLSKTAEETGDMVGNKIAEEN